MMAAMRIADFALERYFARWEFAVEHLLCASDVQGYPMAELLALADAETRAMWDGLTLGYTESTGHPLLRREIAALYDGLEPDDVLVFAGAEEGDLLSRQRGPRPRRPRDRDLARLPEPVRGRARDRCGRHPPRAARGRRMGDRPRPASTPGHAGDAAHRRQRPAQPDRDAARSRDVRRHRRASPRRAAPTSSWTRSTASSSSMRRIGCRPVPTRRRAGSPSASCRSRSRWPACGSAGWRRAIATCWRGAPASRTTRRSAPSAPSEVLALIGLRARDTVLARSREIVGANLERLDAFFDDWADRFSVGPPAGWVGRVPAADRARCHDRRVGGGPGRGGGRPAPARIAVRLRRQSLPARVRTDRSARRSGPSGAARAPHASLIAAADDRCRPLRAAPDDPTTGTFGPPRIWDVRRCTGAPPHGPARRVLRRVPVSPLAVRPSTT